MTRRMATWASFALAVTLIGSGCDRTDPVTPVDEAPTMQLLTPNGGEALTPGSVVTITWTATDDIAVAAVDLSYIARGLSAAETIASGVTTATYDWTLPAENLFTVRVIAVARDSAGQTAADTSDALLAIVAATDNGYVTSQACATCHPFHLDEINQSGHPFMVTEIEGGQAPTFPHSSVPNPPQGFSWNDVTYVIGGYGWGARFLNSDGYFMTDGLDGVNTQFNIARDDLGGGLPAEWAAFHPADGTRRAYDCGACHTTGWQSSADNGGVHQDGLVGIEGTWAETGVTCESCHGAGVTHVVTQNADDITIDTSAELCGNCHTNDAGNLPDPEAGGGFIMHHEQYDEMLQAGHSVNTCASCHDPHLGSRYGNGAAGGIVATCESCHADVTTNNHILPVDCETCHMSRATMSARLINPFQSDVRTHIFAINPNPFPRDSMFYVDETSGRTLTRGRVTLDLVCYQCHRDPGTGAGGSNSIRSLAELSLVATGIHN